MQIYGNTCLCSLGFYVACKGTSKRIDMCKNTMDTNQRQNIQRRLINEIVLGEESDIDPKTTTQPVILNCI